MTDFAVMESRRSVEMMDDDEDGNCRCLRFYPPLPQGITERNKMVWVDFGLRIILTWPVRSNAQNKYLRRILSCCLARKGKGVGEDEAMKTTVTIFDGVRVRIHQPKKRSGNGAILYIHGGGFAVGSASDYDCISRQISKESGLVLVSIDYRLAPKHKYPAAVIDCERAAIHFITSAHKAYGVDPSKVVLMGDSAGGNLAAVTVQRLRKLDIPQPKLQVLIYPWMQIIDYQLPSYLMMEKYSETSIISSKTLARCALLYLIGPDIGRYIPALLANQYTSAQIRQLPEFDCLRPAGPSKSARQQSISTRSDTELYNLLKPFLLDPDVNPLMHPRLKGTPKTMVVTAQYDPMRDDGILYAERLRNAGVPVVHKHYEHGFHAFLDFGVAIAAEAITEIAVFVNENL